MPGRTSMLIHGRQVTVVPNPTYNPVGAPGSLETYFRAANYEGRALRDIVSMQPIQPEYQNRDARVARLDQHVGLAGGELRRRDGEGGGFGLLFEEAVARIAEVLGCSPSTARVVLFNARRKIKAILEKSHGLVQAG